MSVSYPAKCRSANSARIPALRCVRLSYVARNTSRENKWTLQFSLDVVQKWTLQFSRDVVQKWTLQFSRDVFRGTWFKNGPLSRDVFRGTWDPESQTICIHLNLFDPESQTDHWDVTTHNLGTYIRGIDTVRVSSFPHSRCDRPGRSDLPKIR